MTRERVTDVRGGREGTAGRAGREEKGKGSGNLTPTVISKSRRL